jgi:hypothetical protein
MKDAGNELKDPTVENGTRNAQVKVQTTQKQLAGAAPHCVSAPELGSEEVAAASGGTNV